MSNLGEIVLLNIGFLSADYSKQFELLPFLQIRLSFKGLQELKPSENIWVLLLEDFLKRYFQDNDRLIATSC